jgi:hypothetical protein
MWWLQHLQIGDCEETTYIYPIYDKL